MSALNRFHETASDALEKISACLPDGAKLCLTIYTPEKPELDIVLQDKGIDLNEVVSTLRRHGLSIDGDNGYKRDLLNSVVGSLAFGAQNKNPPPAGHWGQRFWDIGREERGLHEELVAALKLNRENLRACQATIHLAGGFDPAYVDDAQAAMAVADAVLAKAGA
ncbi:hypothetical protein SAMN04490189_4554 [Pseudomonas koreensis]|uniref:hypothetical protein n=1 Tax=Pseudomonas koreensis TaxID=198620 RepID=UPI00087DC439|nr:hypothetical protein [Pseudomonas koreensis]KAB0510954.1 hypothetical protein F7R05_22435 [Pseudomonas koreensis]NNA64292.1 hypothetical protein [Pseudomonas koreensis]GGK45839.1 hypothetical protein GCM10009103_45570 [Pseudomonas koreensis]SDE17360.1 hypothetical protein SAMN04490189_4554 [Pseudomonas koreensis]